MEFYCELLPIITKPTNEQHLHPNHTVIVELTVGKLIDAPQENADVTAPIITNVAVTERYCVEICCTEFRPNWSTNVESTGRISFTTS
jgi:hypothetical protein